jgi:glutamine synthetase
MKDKTETQRKQLNVRVPVSLRDAADAEIKRQGRKRDVVIERVIRYFLSLKTSERDSICGRAAVLFFCLTAVGLDLPVK